MKKRLTEPKGGAKFARTPVDIPIGALIHAPWNPRPTITEADVADLAASIAANGLLQRLVVVSQPATCKFLVVAGNRRLVACRMAGLELVPCDRVDVTDEQAKRMTLIENLQRKDVNPVLEARLICELLDGGMTVDAVAAEIGASHGFVVKRSQLRNLYGGFAELALEKGRAFTVEALEKAARHPKEIQQTVFNDLFEGNGRLAEDDGETVTWDSLEYAFENETRDIARGGFDRGDCRTCPKNTACQRDLFDDMGDDVQFGRCMDAHCYQRHRAEAARRIVEDLGPDAVKHDGYPSNIPYAAMADERDETHTEPHWYRTECVNGSPIVVKWVDPKKVAAAKERDEKRDAEWAAERNESRVYGLATKKIRAWWRENGYGEIMASVDAVLATHESTAPALAAAKLVAWATALGVGSEWVDGKYDRQILNVATRIADSDPDAMVLGSGRIDEITRFIVRNAENNGELVEFLARRCCGGVLRDILSDEEFEVVMRGCEAK